MDKINFANAHSPYTELQLARWYTISCILIILMLIGMCSIYVMQWRTYQHVMHAQKAYTAHQTLEQEHTQLQTQHKEREQLRTAQKITNQKMMALNDSLAHDIQLNECFIAQDGTHHLTLTAPSRHRAQECIAALNKKQIFGTLTIVSLKTVKIGDKNHLLVMIKASKEPKQLS